MARFSTEAKVGLVVLMGVVFLTYMTFTVGSYRLGREEGYQIYAVFDSVAGIDLKTPVKIAGVPVGEVERIELDDSKARLTLRIKPEIKIRRGAQTIVRSSGLLGDKYIEIINPASEPTGTVEEVAPPMKVPSVPEPSSWLGPLPRILEWARWIEELGPSSAFAAEAVAQGPPRNEPLIGQGDIIEQKGKSADLDQLINQLNVISEDIKAVSNTLKEALGTKQGEQSLKEIIQNVRDVTKKINMMVDENRGSVNRSVSNLEGFTDSLKESGPRLLESLNRISEKIESGEGTLGRLVQDEELYDRLNGALADVKQITGKIQKGEGTVGKLIYEEEAYDNLNSTLKGIGSTLNRLALLRVFVGIRNEFQLDSSENKGYFSLKLQPQDYKYYLIEVVDEPRGKVTRTTLEQTAPPLTPVTTLKTERKLKFSVELARRFGDLWIRAGLMENSFGVATDYVLFTDQLKFSMDVWDFNSEDPEMDNVRLKFTGALNFLKFFFVQAGYDNILNNKLDTFFVGGAIRFEDEDLKYLLGSAPISF